MNAGCFRGVVGDTIVNVKVRLEKVKDRVPDEKFIGVWSNVLAGCSERRGKLQRKEDFSKVVGEESPANIENSSDAKRPKCLGVI